VRWVAHEPTLVQMRGVIHDFSGLISDDGIVPWFNDWFEIEIERDDGTIAIVVGMHGTAFFGVPTVGAEITAYIAANAPTFVNEPPLYIVTAIVSGDTSGLIFSCDAAHDEFSFFSTEKTTISWSDFNQWQQMHQPLLPEEGGRIPLAEWDWSKPTDWNSPLVIMYDEILDGIPIAQNIAILCTDVLWSVLLLNDVDYYQPEEITLQFTEYIYPSDTFETLTLPIFINGIELDALPPILYNDTIMVPLREIYTAGVGFGNYAFITREGELNVGGGGGSENSDYRIGAAWIRTIGGIWEIDAPTVIVGGVTYIPAMAILYAPFAYVWFYDDRIDFFTEFLPLGPWADIMPWQENPISDEELAAMTIVINGEDTEFSARYNEMRDSVLIPFEAVAQYLIDERSDFYNEVEYVCLQNGLTWDFGLQAILYDDRIIIESVPIRKSANW